MFNQLNISFFNIINHFAGNNIIFDKFVIFLAEYTPYIFILILLYLWFQRKEDKNIVLFAVYSAIVGIVINYIITLLYFHPRPFMDGIGVNLVKHASESSFPSDHTTFMLSIAMLLFYFQFRKKLGGYLLILGLLGGLARIYVGVHYPFDIIASVFVAFVSSSVIFSSRDKLQKFNNFFINIYFKVVGK